MRGGAGISISDGDITKLTKEAGYGILMVQYSDN